MLVLCEHTAIIVVVIIIIIIIVVVGNGLVVTFNMDVDRDISRWDNA